MNIGTWNVRSLSGKEVELVEEIKKYNIDILGITETKKKGKGVENLNGYKLVYSGVDLKERARAGVAVLIRDNIYNDSDINYINERLLEINMDLKDKSVKLIVAYGPNEDAAVNEIDTFYNELQLAIDKTKANQEIIITGDLNARVGNKTEVFCGVIGKEGETTESPNGERLIDLCIRNNMKIANTFFKHKDVHKLTRVVEERNERSIIDYIIVSNSLFYSTHDVRVKRGAEIYSDHFLVIAKMSILPKAKDSKENTVKRTKLRIEKFREDNTQSNYQNTIKKYLELNINTNNEDLESIWKKYKEIITKSAKEVCGTKVIGGPNKRTAWWNESVKAKIKEKKDAWKKYLSSKCQEDMENYKMKRQAAKEEVLKSKQIQWQKFGETLEQNYNENQKLFWGAIKRCRRGKSCPVKHMINSDGEVIKQEDQILENWKQYFEKLHNIGTNESDIQDNNTDEDSTNLNSLIKENDITMVEMLNAKRKRKLGKAPGADGIYPEMVVNQGNEADKLLLNICRLAWKNKTIPNDWKKSTIIPIHKSGPTTQCENYRGISLLSVPGKVYSRIIEARLRSIVEDKLLEHQSGFRPGRSVQDHIFTIRQISEKTLRYNKEVHICFVDLQKAFDSISRKELWKALKEYNVDRELIAAIRSFYHNPESEVQIAGKTSSKFKIKTGVRQGCILSPLLFIILMDSISRKCKGMKPINVGRWKLKPIQLQILSFADDLVMFAKNQRDLETNINILNRELSKRGMKINSKKTKTMVISREPKQHKIRLDNEILEQVNSYKYLGVMIGANGSLREEITQRVGKASKVYGQLGQSFINKRELTVKTKLSIFNSIYCPTLMYGSESWTLENRDKSRLQATEMKFLRRTFGKTKRDKIRNTTIRDRAKTISLEEKIERNQLRWYGHVCRMAENRIPKQIFECKQEGKLPRGRPKKMWIEVISENVEKRGCKLNEAKKRSSDRTKWRTFIHQ